MDGYRHRIMDSLLEKKLQAKGAVLIEGPKWCGKTTTAEEIAASKILLARTDVKNNFKSLLEIDTDAALSGDTPMLIDEWQTVPKLWDAVRYTVDHRRKMGQFILTGSAVPNKETEDFEEDLFDMRFKKITLCVYSDSYNDSIDINIPFYKDDEYIKSLFLEILGVEYNSDYCTYIFWS